MSLKTVDLNPSPPAWATFLSPRLYRILLIALPSAIALVTQGLINQVDLFFIGQIGTAMDPQYAPEAANQMLDSVRSDGQAAVGISTKVLWLYAGMLSSLAIGTQAMVARRYGEGDGAEVGKVAFNSVVVSLVLSIIFTFVAILSLPSLFGYISAGADGVISTGIAYSEVRLAALVLIVWTASQRAFFDGLGKTWIFMVIAVVMNAFNVILDYGLVFGAWGMPRLETVGAAWASALSALLGLGALVIWSGLGEFKSFKLWNWRNLDLSLMRRIFVFSLPNALATAIMTGGFLLFDKVVADLDSQRVAQSLSDAGIAVASLSQTALNEAAMNIGITTSLYQAATQVIIAVMMVFFMTGFGFGAAAATLVSQQMGAGHPEEAAKDGWMTVLVGGGMMALLGLVLVVVPESVAAVFNPQDTALHAAAAVPLRIVGFGAFVVAGCLILTQALYSAGMPRYVAGVTVLGICWLVPGARWLGITLGYGLPGVWMAAMIFVSFLFVAMGAMFLSGRWHKIRI
jgi:MATE family multidrug resistance protein